MSSRKLSRATPKPLSTQTHLKAIGDSLICIRAKSMAILHSDYSKLRMQLRRIKMLHSTDKFPTVWEREVLCRVLRNAIMWELVKVTCRLKHHLERTASMLLYRIRLWKVRSISYLDMVVVNQASWLQSLKISQSKRATKHQVWKSLETANNLFKSSLVWLIIAKGWLSLTKGNMLNYKIGWISHMITTVSTIKIRIKIKTSICGVQPVART